jgi:hypothetical protein
MAMAMALRSSTAAIRMRVLSVSGCMWPLSSRSYSAVLTAPFGPSEGGYFLAAGETKSIFLPHAVERACINRHGSVQVGVTKKDARRIISPGSG